MTDKAKTETVTTKEKLPAKRQELAVTQLPATAKIVRVFTKDDQAAAKKPEKVAGPKPFKFGPFDSETASDIDSAGSAVLDAMVKAGQTKAVFEDLGRPMGHFGNRKAPKGMYTPKLSDIETDKAYTRGEFNNATHGLWIMGIKLKPVATGVRKKVNAGPYYSSGFDVDLGLDPSQNLFTYRSHMVEIKPDMEFSVYQFESEGKIHTYMLDSTSKVWIMEDQTDRLAMPWVTAKRQIRHDMGSAVIMVGATITHSTCYNAVTLIGGVHRACLFSDSSVNCLEEDKKELDLPWGGRKHDGRDDSYDLNQCYLERTHAIRSKLSGGSYFQSHIRDSKVECPSNVKIDMSHLTNAKLTSNNMIMLHGATLTDYWIRCNRNLLLASQTLKDGNLEVDELFALNKLGISTFDNPFGSSYNVIKLIMVDRDTMELQKGSSMDRCKLRTFKADYALRDDVEAWVEKALATYDRYNDDPDQQPTTSTDIITKSMIRYLVDSIMSRIGVIKTANQAIEIGRMLESREASDMLNYF